MPLTVALIEDLESLRRHVAGWDALAVACARPACAPAWALGWWGNAAPKRAVLRTAVVHDGDDLIGLAPFYAESGVTGTTLRALGAGVSARVEPLATPGREREVAVAIAQALAKSGPAALRLDGMDERSLWPELLTEHWPGGARRVLMETGVAPFISLDGDFDAWLHSRSTNARHQLGRTERNLAKAGGGLRQIQTPGDREVSLAAFARLHEQRWADRGGSGVLNAGVERMLAQAADELSEDGRMRIFVAEIGAEIIGVGIFLEAGGDITYWLGGHDDAHAKLRPGQLVLQAAIRDAFERGDHTLDIGFGEQGFKERFATGKDTLSWWIIIPRGRRSLLVGGRVAAGRARRALSARVSDEHKARIKKLLRRG